MRSRFVLEPHHGLAHRERGFGPRVAGAIVFFVIGAIVATELYPQITADRRAEYNMSSNSGRATSPIPASEVISDRTQRDVAEYIGGPIPPITFSATQPPPATKDTEAASDQDSRASVVAAEKPRSTENKPAIKKHISHRGNVTSQDRLYLEQPSYWAAGGGWNSWGTYQGGGNFGPHSGRAIQPYQRGQ